MVGMPCKQMLMLAVASVHDRSMHKLKVQNSKVYEKWGSPGCPKHPTSTNIVYYWSFQKVITACCLCLPEIRYHAQNCRLKCLIKNLTRHGTHNPTTLAINYSWMLDTRCYQLPRYRCLMNIKSPQYGLEIFIYTGPWELQCSREYKKFIESEHLHTFQPFVHATKITNL